MPAPIPDQWRALSPLLDEALGMTDEERSTWLSRLRSDDPPLVDNLELLLDRHRLLIREGFLDGSVGMPSEPGLAGRPLGAYRLKSQIGQGGMSSVWLAERADGRFERKVAVKFLQLALIGKAGEERFRREGMILGRLAHPNIAELVDAGVTDAGQPYLILEHIEGDHIDSYCDEHGLSVEARIQLFLGVLQAVAHAHDHSIVHRDLKPPNILVRHDGQVKLLDFGIAKLLQDENQRGKVLQTLEGGRAMTPEYAAPEQLTGAAATIATDIYALGVVLYVLLTGFHPAGAGPHTHPDLVKAILQMEPPRPSDIVVRSRGTADFINRNAARRGTTPGRLSRTLRGDLNTILAKTLKKDPAERYVSVSDLADDLRRYLSHRPIRAQPDTTAYRAAKFMRRRKQSITAALLVALTVIGAATLTWMVSRDPKTLPRITQGRLTASFRDLPITSAAISPDGKYLGYADQQGIHLQRVDTGEAKKLPLLAGIQPEKAYWVFGSWYPDSTRFITSVAVAGRPVGVWSVPIGGGTPQKLADIEDMVGGGKISPNGSTIAFARRRSAFGAHEIWLMGARGESPHKILTENGSPFGAISWSPAGSRIAYSLALPQGDLLVQSCDLEGANQTTILQDNALSGLAWIAPARFIYSRSTQRGGARTGDLWELAVNERGVPHGKPRRLTDWSGYSIHSLSSTADGKHLVFLRSTHHASALVGDLEGNGTRLVNSRRLTADDNINIALAWMPDSRELVFSSQRAATRQIFRQPLDPGSTPRLITSRPELNFYMARMSPDGAWMIVEGEPAGLGKMALYRVPISGGVPQRLFSVEGLSQYWCTNKAANFCVLGRPDPAKSELAISSFDPLSATDKHLLRIPLEPGTNAGVGADVAWQISPDGAWIAFLMRHKNSIRLVPLRKDRARTIAVNGYSDLTDLSWAVNSRSLFVSSQGPGGATLLHVDLSGNPQPIWRQPQMSSIWAFSSPDARHLAISAESRETSVWMIGNF